MKNKSYSLLKILHLTLVTVGIVLYAITLIFFAEDASLINIMSSVFNILTLGAGFVYLSLGYKKDAHLSYKIFMWLFMTAEIIECTSIFSMGIAMSALRAFIPVFTLAIVILLGGAKDYGKVKSNIVSITLVAVRACSILLMILSMSSFGKEITNPGAMVFDQIGQFILATTAALMVCGKYLDKDARSAK